MEEFQIGIRLFRNHRGLDKLNSKLSAKKSRHTIVNTQNKTVLWFVEVNRVSVFNRTLSWLEMGYCHDSRHRDCDCLRDALVTENHV